VFFSSTPPNKLKFTERWGSVAVKLTNHHLLAIVLYFIEKIKMKRGGFGKQ